VNLPKSACFTTIHYSRRAPRAGGCGCFEKLLATLSGVVSVRKTL
jgi:hypothetical protein